LTFFCSTYDCPADLDAETIEVKMTYDDHPNDAGQSFKVRRGGCGGIVVVEPQDVAIDAPRGRARLLQAADADGALLVTELASADDAKQANAQLLDDVAGLDIDPDACNPGSRDCACFRSARCGSGLACVNDMCELAPPPSENVASPLAVGLVSLLLSIATFVLFAQ
jgi:hypothetical protein